MTDAAPLFPLALVTNGWFSLPHASSHQSPVFQFSAQPKSIGFVPYFKSVTFPTYDAATARDLKKLYEAKLRAEQRYRMGLSLKTLGASNNSYDLNRLHQDSLDQAGAYNKRRAETTPVTHDFAIFTTSEGEIGFNISFDIAAAIGALAQQGRIVTLTHDENGFAPYVQYQVPSLPSLRRGLPAAPGKPRALKL